MSKRYSSDRTRLDEFEARSRLNPEVQKTRQCRDLRSFHEVLRNADRQHVLKRGFVQAYWAHVNSRQQRLGLR